MEKEEFYYYVFLSSKYPPLESITAAHIIWICFKGFSIYQVDNCFLYILVWIGILLLYSSPNGGGYIKK